MVDTHEMRLYIRKDYRLEEWLDNVAGCPELTGHNLIIKLFLYLTLFEGTFTNLNEFYANLKFKM